MILLLVESLLCPIIDFLGLKNLALHLIKSFVTQCLV